MPGPAGQLDRLPGPPDQIRPLAVQLDRLPGSPDQAPRGPAGPAAWTGCLDLDRLRTPWGDSVSNVTIGVIDAIGIIDA